MAGVALGAVVAVALTMFNRLRPSKETKPAAVFHVGPVNSTGAAVMDPPAPAADRPANNNSRSSGVVTPEEAVDLPFTASELYAAIPERCFKKSLFWGLFYCFRDWGIVAALYYFQPAFFGLGLAGKLLWWNITGFYGWCLFVVGHDCGHGTFSNYGWVNQLFGHICHAPLMVPFNGWRISHRHHHQYHNDVDRDHSWRPSVAKNVDRLSTPIKWFRFSPLILLVYPFYLLSPSQENGFSGNHFWPWNPLFKKEERVGIAASALSVVAWAGVIAAATAHFGFWAVFQNYWIPYWIFVAWLDLVTLMQHTDDNVLYFRGKAWNYLRGAMSTVDRTYRHIIDPFNLGYGRVIDHLHHNISDGHVIHHIFFTQIPHYRLMEATEALKPMLGKHYRFDDTPVPSAFMRTLKNCWYVEDEGGVVAYKGKPEFKGWEKANMA
jgi:omega-3 fatty acid desaturase (delta-15 desaturase)